MQKRALKIYGWTWVVVIAASILTFTIMAIHTSHHDLAKDPENIEKILKVDLPAIAYSESEDNLDRSASRWDIFEHKGKFISELSDDTINILDELCLTDSLHWRKAADKGVYSFYDEGGIDELYYVFCLISKDGFSIIYEVDESEGLFVLLPFAIIYSILFKWGLALMVIALIRRIRDKFRQKRDISVIPV